MAKNTPSNTHTHTHTHTHTIHSFFPAFFPRILFDTLLLSTDTYEREALTRFWGVPSDDDGVRGVDGVDVNDEGEWVPLERVPPRDPLTNEVLSSRVHFTNWGKRREVQAS